MKNNFYKTYARKAINPHDEIINYFNSMNIIVKIRELKTLYVELKTL